MEDDQQPDGCMVLKLQAVEGDCDRMRAGEQKLPGQDSNLDKENQNPFHPFFATTRHCPGLFGGKGLGQFLLSATVRQNVPLCGLLATEWLHERPSLYLHFSFRRPRSPAANERTKAPVLGATQDRGFFIGERTRHPATAQVDTVNMMLPLTIESPVSMPVSV
jgi:hypothetical protein